MKKLKQRLGLGVVLVVALGVFCAAASVQAGWKKSGVEITSGTLATYTAKNNESSVSDGRNGIIFIYKKNSKYYIQRLNSQAEKVWGEDGVFITKDKSGKKMVADKSGGMFIVFNRGSKVYVQHINKSGKKKWGSKGKMIFYGNKLYDPDGRIVSDRKGGAFVSSTMTKEDGKYTTYIGRINKKGKILWRKLGEFGNKIISDKRGNVYTVAETENTYYYKLTKLNFSGEILWTSSTMYVHSFKDLILSDKNGIIIIGSPVGLENQLFAWKIDSQGKTKWSGKRLSGIDSYVAGLSSFVSDGKGGVIAVWYNLVGSYTQRITANGRRVWGKDDKLITADTEEIEAISDGQGGVIVKWNSGTLNDGYFQKINRSGDFKWGDGIKFSGENGIFEWNDSVGMSVIENKSVIILSNRYYVSNSKNIGIKAYKIDRHGNVLGD